MCEVASKSMGRHRVEKIQVKITRKKNNNREGWMKKNNNKRTY